MTATFEITDDMRALIGVESEPWPYEVTTTAVRAFARGVGYEDPVYYDAAAARAAGRPGLAVPPCYLGTPVYLPGCSDGVFSGPRGTGPRPRYGLANVLDGGTEVIYERPLQTGETLMSPTAWSTSRPSRAARSGRWSSSARRPPTGMERASWSPASDRSTSSTRRPRCPGCSRWERSSRR